MRSYFSRVVILLESVEVCVVKLLMLDNVAVLVVCRLDIAVALFLLLSAASTNSSANASATPTFMTPFCPR